MIAEHAQCMLNRDRAIGLYCSLIGTYHEWMRVSSLKIDGDKDNRKTVRMYPDDCKNFLERYVPALIRFCGSYFTEYKNPDCLPHPIRIAIELKHGRKEGVIWGMKHLEANKMLPKGMTANAMVSKVISLMHDHGMIDNKEVA